VTITRAQLGGADIVEAEGGDPRRAEAGRGMPAGV
jgi:hypothetical protein